MLCNPQGCTPNLLSCIRHNTTYIGEAYSQTQDRLCESALLSHTTVFFNILHVCLKLITCMVGITFMVKSYYTNDCYLFYAFHYFYWLHNYNKRNNCYQTLSVVNIALIWINHVRTIYTRIQNKEKTINHNPQNTVFLIPHFLTPKLFRWGLKNKNTCPIILKCIMQSPFNFIMLLIRSITKSIFTTLSDVIID